MGEPGERSRNVDYVTPTETIDVVDLAAVTVSNVDIQQQSIAFEVDQVGVPVLVRVSYFPTWRVEGAEGPYRVAPNFMVVIPTDTQVKLTYSKTALDWFFYSLTFVGIALCFYWRRKGDVVYAGERPDWRRPVPSAEAADPARDPGPDPDPDPSLDDTTPIDAPWSADAPPAPTVGDR